MLDLLVFRGSLLEQIKLLHEFPLRCGQMAQFVCFDLDRLPEGQDRGQFRSAVILHHESI